MSVALTAHNFPLEHSCGSAAKKMWNDCYAIYNRKNTLTAAWSITERRDHERNIHVMCAAPKYDV